MNLGKSSWRFTPFYLKSTGYHNVFMTIWEGRVKIRTIVTVAGSDIHRLDADNWFLTYHFNMKSVFA
jgi:hypothetical protein